MRESAGQVFCLQACRRDSSQRSGRQEPHLSYCPIRRLSSQKQEQAADFLGVPAPSLLRLKRKQRSEDAVGEAWLANTTLVCGRIKDQSAIEMVRLALFFL